MATRMMNVLFVLVLASALHAGELETKGLASEALGQEVKVNVLLPDGYRTEGDRRYPAIYLLHGLGGDYSEWARVGIAEEAKGLPVLIVMPEGDKSFYVNHHQDPKGRWEDYVAREVVAFTDKNYRTIPRRESRGIAGLSMGGYGAMVLGLRHPDLFSTIASHSGALMVPGGARPGEVGDRINKIFGPEGSEERKSYDLKRLLAELPREKLPDLYIHCGSADFLLDANRSLVAELARLKLPYEYREAPGAHDFAYWKRNARHSLVHQLEAMKRAESPAAVATASAPEKTAEKKPEPGLKLILGEWDMLVETEEGGIDYVLRFTEKEKRLDGVLVSPRSGPHPCRLVQWKDGALRVEVDRNYEGQEVTVVYEAKLTDQGLSGTMTAKGFEQINAKWTAKRKQQIEEL